MSTLQETIAEIETDIIGYPDSVPYEATIGHMRKIVALLKTPLPAPEADKVSPPEKVTGAAPEGASGAGIQFLHNQAHAVGTCARCGQEMVFKVPRLGPDGGYVHKDSGFICKAAESTEKYQGPVPANSTTDPAGALAAEPNKTCLACGKSHPSGFGHVCEQGGPVYAAEPNAGQRAQVTEIRQLVAIAVYELHTEWAQEENNAPTTTQIDRVSAVVHAAVEAAVAKLRFSRCVKHLSVPQINSTEHSGAECGACIQERFEILKAFVENVAAEKGEYGRLGYNQPTQRAIDACSAVAQTKGTP